MFCWSIYIISLCLKRTVELPGGGGESTAAAANPAPTPQMQFLQWRSIVQCTMYSRVGRFWNFLANFEIQQDTPESVRFKEKNVFYLEKKIVNLKKKT